MSRIDYLGELPESIKNERTARQGHAPKRNVKANMQVVQRAKFATNVFTADPASSKAVLNANVERNYLLIQNNGGSDVFVNFGSKASLTGIKIVSGGNYEPTVVPVDSVYLTSNTGFTNLCAVVEGVELK